MGRQSETVALARLREELAEASLSQVYNLGLRVWDYGLGFRFKD
jgi:hypothetical protein